MRKNIAKKYLNWYNKIERKGCKNQENVYKNRTRNRE